MDLAEESVPTLAESETKEETFHDVAQGFHIDSTNFSQCVSICLFVQIVKFLYFQLVESPISRVKARSSL